MGGTQPSRDPGGIECGKAIMFTNGNQSHKMRQMPSFAARKTADYFN
jgi:hypothetical protein